MRRSPFMRGAFIWAAIFFLLFTQVNASSLALASASSVAALCEQGAQPDQGDHRHAADCPCCVTACCAAIALSSGAAEPVPSSAWTVFRFAQTARSFPTPALRAGGYARAPPSIA